SGGQAAATPLLDHEVGGQGRACMGALLPNLLLSRFPPVPQVGRPEHLGLAIAGSFKLLKERPKSRGIRFRGWFTPRDSGQSRVHDLPEDPGVALLASLPIQPFKGQLEAINLRITRLGGFRSV